MLEVVWPQKTLNGRKKGKGIGELTFGMANTDRRHTAEPLTGTSMSKGGSMQTNRMWKCKMDSSNSTCKVSIW